MNSLGLTIVLLSIYKLDLRQINIKVANLNEKKKYVQIPFRDKNLKFGKSRLLQKALSGLKQA